VEDAAKELADAEADLQAAQAAAAAAQTLANRSVVRATFDGVVARRAHNAGDVVEAASADPVLRVIDPRRLEVVASVPVADAAAIKPGAAARVVGAGRAPLKVAARPVAVQEGTVTVAIRLAFTGTPSYPVGAPVEVEIDRETHTDVVLVPASAVVREAGEAAVFVVMAGNKASRRAVTLGLESSDKAEITSGVKAGEAVITVGQNGLPDGAEVTAAPSAGEGGSKE
jgi:RND family efflux transporter MFP subunit